MDRPSEIAADKKRFLMKKPTFSFGSNYSTKIFKEFAHRQGLVFFATMGRADEDYEMVRGLTASARHRDRNFCIGAYDGYDITLLERVDTIEFPHKKPSNHQWVVLAIDLKSNGDDTPHVFMSAHEHSETFYANLFSLYSTLRVTPMNSLQQHSVQFMNAYTVYSVPHHAIEVERLFIPEITSVIGAHFKPLAIELRENTLYIYADNQKINFDLLNIILKNGVWLAASLDKNRTQI